MATLSALPVRAQESPAGDAVSTSLPAFSGPAAPIAPEVFARDEQGRITLRATRLTEPLTLDGALDETAYREVKPITHFVQMEPRQGQPAEERTEAWLLFDDQYFYVSVRSYDSQPSRLVANEMRRDSFNVFQNDNLTVSIDSLYTRRSGYFFQTNALGALRDQEVFDERSNNQDWNTIWYTRSRILEDGWTTEIAIPFKSLRFRTAGPQVWGFNLRRLVRWRNEQHTIAPIPASAGNRAMYRFDIFATLVGVETPSQARNLEVKPYAIGSLTTNRAARPPFTDDLSTNAGGDVKYGITKSLVADLTVRTDFAQVEEDQQQVNLTRFSLFFPERRDFFLEGQGLFNFGSGQRGGDGSSGPSLTPVVFYSRRIGLSNAAQSVPIEAGGRLSGRIGKSSVGLLNIQTGESPTASAPATNFSVVRLRRDVLRRSNVGLIGTYRAPGEGPANSVFGLDANLAFFQNVIAQGFWTMSNTEGGTASVVDRSSYRGEFEYNGDRYGARIEHLAVGDGYDPQIGFLRREAFSRHYGNLRFSPRPRQATRIRKHYYEAEFDYINGSDGVLETQEARGHLPPRTAEQRSVAAGVRPRLRAAAAAVLGRPRPADSGRRLPVRRPPHRVSVRPAAASVGHRHARTGRLLRGDQDRSRLPRTRRGVASAHAGARRHHQLARPAGRPSDHAPHHQPHQPHAVAADGARRQRPVQLDDRQHRVEHQVPVGVPGGERSVRGLQRRPRHAGAPWLPRPREPHLRGQGDAPLAVLTAPKPRRSSPSVKRAKAGRYSRWLRSIQAFFSWAFWRRVARSAVA